MTQPKTLTLSHPVTLAKGEARQVGYWHENGRAIGLKLDFGDGKVFRMKYDEIQRLKETAVTQTETAA
jgi:hypothetical protein